MALSSIHGVAVAHGACMKISINSENCSDIYDHHLYVGNTVLDNDDFRHQLFGVTVISHNILR